MTTRPRKQQQVVVAAEACLLSTTKPTQPNSSMRRGLVIVIVIVVALLLLSGTVKQLNVITVLQFSGERTCCWIAVARTHTRSSRKYLPYSPHQPRRKGKQKTKTKNIRHQTGPDGPRPSIDKRNRGASVALVGLPGSNPLVLDWRCRCGPHPSSSPSPSPSPSPSSHARS